MTKEELDEFSEEQKENLAKLLLIACAEIDADFLFRLLTKPQITEILFQSPITLSLIKEKLDDTQDHK